MYSIAKEIIHMVKEDNVSETDLAAYLLFIFDNRDDMNSIDNVKWTSSIDSPVIDTRVWPDYDWNINT